MHQRTKATAIPPAVKLEVYERDGGLCIFCGRRGDPVAHVLSRAQGGMGVPRNIVTACPECHRLLDGVKRREMQLEAKIYLRAVYGPFDDTEVIYDKRRRTDEQG